MPAPPAENGPLKGEILPDRVKGTHKFQKPTFIDAPMRNDGTRAKQVCVICNHRIRRLDVKGRQLCSIRCMKVYEAKEKEHQKLLKRLAYKEKRGKWFYTEREKRTRRMTRALSKIATLETVSPEQQGKMRREILSCVKDQLVEAHLQVLGVTKEGAPISKEDRWTSTQARLFSTLLAKVLPDAPQDRTAIADTSLPLSEMSREDLELIAASELAKLANPEPALKEIPPDVELSGPHSPYTPAEEVNDADASAPTPDDEPRHTFEDPNS